MYNQQHQGPQLPPDVPSNLMVNGLPHRMPFQVTLTLDRPFFQNDVAMLAGMFANEIQRLANLDFSRKALFYTLAENSFNNQRFFFELNSLAVFAEWLLAAGKVNDPRSAVGLAAEHYTAMLAAEQAMTYPVIIQSMNQQQQNDQATWYGNLQNIKQQLAHFVQTTHPLALMGGNQQQQVGYRGGQQTDRYGNPVGNNGGGWGAPQQNGYGGGWNPSNFAAMQQRNSAVNHNQFATSTSGGYLGNNGQKTSNSSAAGSDMFYSEPIILEGGGELIQKKPEQKHTPIDIPEKPTEVITAAQEPKSFTDVFSNIFNGTENAQAEQPQQRTSVIKEIVMNGDQVSMVDHTVKIPAYNSELSLSPSTAQVYPKCYDLGRDRMLFSLKGNKVIGESTESIPEDDVEFKDHDLLYLLQPTLNEDKEGERSFEEARNAFDNILRQSNLSVLLDEAAKLANTVVLDDKKIPTENVVEIDDIGDPDSEDFMASVVNYFNGEGITFDPDNNSFSMQHRRKSGWFFSGPEAADLMSIQNAATWETLLSRFMNAREFMYSFHWNAMHELLTNTVNEIITVYVGLKGVRIRSFVDDIVELGESIQKYDGSFFYERFIETANIAARRVFTAVDNTSEEYKEYFQTEGVENTDDYSVRFLQYIDVTYIPISSADIPYYMHGKVGTVSRSRTPELYKAIEHRLKSVSFDYGYNYFLTKDNKRIHFYKPLDVRSDVFLIRVD